MNFPNETPPPPYIYPNIVHIEESAVCVGWGWNLRKRFILRDWIQN